MSTELDALDRGAVDAGMAAAEALARVEVVEARVEAIFSYMREQTDAWEAWRQVTRPRPARRERHLSVVKP